MGPLYSVKSCGKAHAYCGVCNPAANAKNRANKRQPEVRLQQRVATLANWRKPNVRAMYLATMRSPEARAKRSAAKRGDRNPMRRPEVAAKSGAGQRMHIETAPPGCRCVGCRVPISPTKIELALQRLLADFPEVIPEKRFGLYRVDAYLPPPYHLAFEADGEYWHDHNEKARPGYHAKRDAYLLKRFNLPVIRLSEEELSVADLARLIR